MITRELTYYSDGLKLEGLLQLPDDRGDSERLPAVIVLSGVQGLKEWVPGRWWPAFVEERFAVMAFDYRGFGTSEGERGRLIPEEEIRDVFASLTFLRQQPEVDADRIGALGWGLGGGIALAVAARDARVRAVASVNGPGNVGRTVRDGSTYTQWLDLQERLAADRVQRVATGSSARIPFNDLHYPGRSAMEKDIREQFNQDMRSLGREPIQEFTLETAEAYYNFRPEEEVERISPRPLLVVHGDQNFFMPVDEARSIFTRAREPKQLIIIPGAKHLEWIAPESPFRRAYMQRVVAWFQENLKAATPEETILSAG
jgi:uncharacterized protein